MEEGGDLEISGCGSTTTTTTVDDDIGCYWNHWSPVADLGTFCANDHEFRSLMESMMSDDMDCEDGVGALTDAACTPSVTTTTGSTSTRLPADEPSHDEKGMRLVHLLMGAAEALTGPHRSRELARVILVRLKELVSTAGGSNMERLAAHFTDALQGLLDGSHPTAGTRTAHRDNNHHHHNPADVLTAFQLLQDMSPYVKFGHFTANQAILEAVSGERRVHIIDYDIAEGVQWASLMQAMVSRHDGPPPPHLRITAVARGGSGGSRGALETGRRLAAFAASLGQPFSFGQCRLDADEHFRPAGVRVVKGEVVLANCALHHAAATSAGMPKQSPGRCYRFCSAQQSSEREW
uniref:Uncharacterized protein n=1 Tax=Ananas comosus var. bracteatus TaxID=296719 RepID=A0A6V7Q2T2_ANACO|nr:unnamed protein product [Ananas comosus var. bracteatus]